MLPNSCNVKLIVKYLRTASTSSRNKWCKSFSTSSPVKNRPPSYFYCSPQVNLVGKTIGQALDQAAAIHPNKEAFVFIYQNIRKTFAELHFDVNNAAAGLLSVGLEPGDRVGIWGPNSYEWVVTQLAAAQMGAVLVNINPAYQTSELEYCIKKVGMKGIVSAKNFKTQNYYTMISKVCPELKDSQPGDLQSQRCPSLKTVVMISDEDFSGALKFKDVMDNGSSDDKQRISDIQKKINFDDPVNIQFTSGTTGFPKGCTLSHFNLLNNAFSISNYLGFFEEGDHTVAFPIPLYHTFASTGSVMSALTSYIRSVFPTPSFEPEPLLKAINDEGVTSVYATPTMFIDMLNHPNFDKYNYETLQSSIMGGAPCPAAIVDQLHTRMGIKDMLVGYGLTETSPLITITPKSMPAEKRVTCVGVVAYHQEVKIVDPSTGRIVPSGEQGELCVRGYNVMLGYWEDEEKTREAIDQAKWFHTGDLATLDEDGVVRITGRIKDMIIRGGENIYPAEIEQFLYTNPKVAEVQVVGIPDERMGEEVCACVRLKADETATPEEIIGFCKGKITHFKIPRYVVFVTQFPLTVTGKVKKFELRAQMADTLNLKQ